MGRSKHGVRKALAELLTEEGCREHQIMSVLSHTQPSTSAIYTKGAERRAMAVETIQVISVFGWSCGPRDFSLRSKLDIYTHKNKYLMW